MSLEIDPLDAVVKKMASVRVNMPPPPVPSRPTGTTLCQLVEKNVEHRTICNRWAEKTANENRAIYALAVRYFSNIPLADLTNEKAIDFMSLRLKCGTGTSAPIRYDTDIMHSEELCDNLRNLLTAPSLHSDVAATTRCKDSSGRPSWPYPYGTGLANPYFPTRRVGGSTSY